LKSPALSLCQEQPEVLVQEAAALYSQDISGGEVGLGNPAPFVQAEVAHRGEVVEVGVSIPGFRQTHLGLPEFFVLHLQFDLVHPQFVDQADALSRRKFLRGNSLLF
jgi:hypothetical protein